jgi:2-polyprenyl-3-methyl-5-hydroxy-6-metoxy-1,4-benzoquinol methylase
MPLYGKGCKHLPIFEEQNLVFTSQFEYNMGITRLIKKILPDAILAGFNKIREGARWSSYKNLSAKEVFTRIYSEHVWGQDQSNPNAYFSGGGSHDAALIDPYIAAVKKFIASLEIKPDVMDLGCGDFNIGSKLRACCNKYIACDIVDTLIEHNKVKFKEAAVDFRVFDLTNEKCDPVDIVFVRQVFQHLSNDGIKKGLKNIIPFCKYLVITEHLPGKNNFKRNIDKPTGPGTRAELYSGIDIGSSPFNYTDLKGDIICEVQDNYGIIQTVVYKCS